MNGKALVSGLNLVEMDASDMVDVLHYFFEEDTLRYSSGEQAEAASKFRTSFYDMYDIEYKYAISVSKDGVQATSGGRKYIEKNEDYDLDDVTPWTPNKAIKPYVPPTQMDADSSDPFGGVLDAPIR